MKITPYLYLSPHRCEGSHGEGWQLPFDSVGLPPARSWVESLPETVFGSSTLSLFLTDAWLNPLRVSLEERAKPSELPQFLLWKLKRYLPWPTDQVALRYLPLSADLTWLTFSLPKPWLDAVHQAFKDRGVHCGFIGGAFAALLENQPLLRNHVNLCFFDDYYLLAELDAAGNYLQFTMRRLPFLDQEGLSLDLETLHQQDLAALGSQNRPLQLFSLSHTLDAALAKLAGHLEQASVTLVRPKLAGSSLTRIVHCLSGGAWA